uniref:cAMP-responsive element modulator n=2 Tax=Sus scrofa TaxID=9823 RepID=A0A5K1VH22_PIG
MNKCGRKKYIKTNLRQMTMETIDSQQDGSIPDSVAESESAHMQMQTGQNSVPTLAQVATIAETDESAESEGVIDSHKRREILSRRPSYRKILNELSSDVPGVPKIEEEKSEEEGTPPNIAAMAVPTSIYQTSTGQYSMYAATPYDVVLALSLW